MKPQLNLWKHALFIVLLALALSVLSVPSSAVKPSSSAGTFEAWVNASSWGAANQTIFSAPSEGSSGSTGLVGYWRFNNDSAVGEA